MTNYGPPHLRNVKSASHEINKIVTGTSSGFIMRQVLNVFQFSIQTFLFYNFNNKSKYFINLKKVFSVYFEPSKHLSLYPISGINKTYASSKFKSS